ncbi:hypothetical protein HC762_01310 [bacterium]|nr:hypothetical protein [bacterium]
MVGWDGDGSDSATGPGMVELRFPGLVSLSGAGMANRFLGGTTAKPLSERAGCSLVASNAGSVHESTTELLRGVAGCPAAQVAVGSLFEMPDLLYLPGFEMSAEVVRNSTFEIDFVVGIDLSDSEMTVEKACVPTI